MAAMDQQQYNRMRNRGQPNMQGYQQQTFRAYEGDWQNNYHQNYQQFQTYGSNNYYQDGCYYNNQQATVHNCKNYQYNGNVGRQEYQYQHQNYVQQFHPADVRYVTTCTTRQTPSLPQQQQRQRGEYDYTRYNSYHQGEYLEPRSSTAATTSSETNYTETFPPTSYSNGETYLTQQPAMQNNAMEDFSAHDENLPPTPYSMDLHSPSHQDLTSPQSVASLDSGCPISPSRMVDHIHHDQDYYLLTTGHKSEVLPPFTKKGHNEDYMYSQQTHHQDNEQITTGHDEKLQQDRNLVPLHEIVSSVLNAHSNNGTKRKRNPCDSTTTVTATAKKYDDAELDTVLKSVFHEFETLEFSSGPDRSVTYEINPPAPKMIRLEFCPETLEEDDEHSGQNKQTEEGKILGKRNTGGEEIKQKSIELLRDASSSYNLEEVQLEADKSIKDCWKRQCDTNTMLSFKRSSGHTYRCAACMEQFQEDGEIIRHVVQNSSLFRWHQDLLVCNEGGEKLGRFMRHFGFRLKLENRNGNEVTLDCTMECLLCHQLCINFSTHGNNMGEIIHKHLNDCRKIDSHETCIFCDRRVADIGEHLRSFVNVHNARILALSPIKCSKLRVRNEKAALVTSPCSAARCQCCGAKFKTDLKMPDWLARQICNACIKALVVLRNFERKIVLCSFCVQGKYGYQVDTSSSNSKSSITQRHNKTSICIDCFEILDTFKSKVLSFNEEIQGNCSSNIRVNNGVMNVEECYETFRRMFDNLVSKREREIFITLHCKRKGRVWCDYFLFLTVLTVTTCHVCAAKIYLLLGKRQQFYYFEVGSIKGRKYVRRGCLGIEI